MQILAVLLFTSLAMAAPAATSGGIKPSDAPCKPDKPINQEADVDGNPNEALVVGNEVDPDEEEYEPLDFEPHTPTRPLGFTPPPVQHSPEEAPVGTYGQDDEDEEEIEPAPLDFTAHVPTRPFAFPLPPVDRTAELAGSA
ncbi:uncharacterized protein BBA_09499 [Beauveria bassiana ARSEF 2860]|uniref:Uncharacterized protein n=1 Tax=Beauveria bassiana (strain ARSEF 2860) TaxID=655819 RepID=J5JCB2_BEAB2|nr:uncharacterized protein BBA_09499 [Beauveria bassiana ARSEF 2860]EJP61531.1 hypothetical protein BBA_09499 [Beauveria bassiana ARSEF 2860]